MKATNMTFNFAWEEYHVQGWTLTVDRIIMSLPSFIKMAECDTVIQDLITKAFKLPVILTGVSKSFSACNCMYLYTSIYI